MNETPETRKVDINPVECIRQGWELVKPQYWLFVGICAVAILLGSAVPMGILLGPMLCGVYICLFTALKEETVQFDQLFKGFDHFLPSFLVTLIQTGITLIIAFGSLISMAITIALSTASTGTEPEASAGFIVGIFGMFSITMALSYLIGLFMVFTYPLIADKGLGVLDSIKTSFFAVKANIWQLIGLFLLTLLMGLAGALCCYVGAFLVMPISFGAYAVAYSKVFQE